jgi:fructose-1,6-bisphosphatase I
MHLFVKVAILLVPACAFVLNPINSNSQQFNLRSSHPRSQQNRDYDHHHLTRRKASTLREKSCTSTHSCSNNSDDAGDQFITLPQYLRDHNVDHELHEIICQTANACLKISQELAKLPITSLLKDDKKKESGNINVQGEEQKPMDVVANEIFISSLKDRVAAMASEEEEDIIKSENPLDSSYEIAFDPLDGSSNLDVSVPTGSIFGIAPHTPTNPFSSSGRSLVSAGYSVYSSSLEFVISLSPSTVSESQSDDKSNLEQSAAAGFTLDPRRLSSNCEVDGAECFVLSRPNMKCPPKGNFYSLNDGREPDWPEGLKSWIHDAKRGLTPSGTTYSSRYVCSLCADVHRTFIKGGWAGNPRPHLRLLYEAAPLAHIAEACGGRGSDGIMNLLDIKPVDLHSRTCVFIGSIEDVKELESYGDVQQSPKTY